MRKDAGKTRINLEKFMTKVMPEPNTGCWIWTGAVLQKSGHGKVLFKNIGLHTAHRASYYLHYGDIPEGINVLHKCDVPCCVNPEHLYLGTQKDNMNDRDSRNRGNWKSGEQNHRSLISNMDATIIKELLNYGIKQKVIAKLFNVNRSLISDISTGRTWTNI